MTKKLPQFDPNSSSEAVTDYLYLNTDLTNDENTGDIGRFYDGHIRPALQEMWKPDGFEVESFIDDAFRAVACIAADAAVRRVALRLGFNPEAFVRMVDVDEGYSLPGDEVELDWSEVELVRHGQRVDLKLPELPAEQDHLTECADFLSDNARGRYTFHEVYDRNGTRVIAHFEDPVDAVFFKMKYS